MLFTSPTFLFGFLPIALLLYYLSPKIIKNLILLLLSLFFYAWGEVFYLSIMLVSIGCNYIFGLLISNSQKQILSNHHNKLIVTVKNKSLCKTESFKGTILNMVSYVNFHDKLPQFYLFVAVVVNLLLLISFKYANFISDNVNVLFSIMEIPVINLTQIHLPLGISFFTFQALSYIIDVYRQEVSSQKNIFNLALYISLFPQLIAGPIVRYHDVALQILKRSCSIELLSSGVVRFIYGLSKKMLVANSMGEIADTVFTFTGNDLTLPLAWIGIIAYTLQIYFDFSGYSDMAIGLGRMFGFKFLENFNYPYISRSVREFWRRWHISLSTWFRDYVYFSMGGNKVSTIRVYVNLFTVFILTGIWHGASWNFLIWGLFHGVFLASEHGGFSNYLKRTWKPVQHIYLLFVIIIGWVFFKADTLPLALNYLYAMFNVFNYNTTSYQFAQILSYEAVYAFIAGIVLSVPVYPLIKKHLINFSQNSTLKLVVLIYIPRLVILTILLRWSFLKIASSTYNPFIYFRF